MQRSFIKKQTNSNKKLSQLENLNSRFNYVIHHDNFPLELKGKMKAHSKPMIKQNMKDLLNYTQLSHAQNKSKLKENINCQNGINSHQNKINQKRNFLAEKIFSNKKIQNQNYQKGILPEQDLRSIKKKTESLKTYKQTRPGSGINYLNAADTKNIYKHPQKKHLQQHHIARRQTNGKKCNFSAQKKYESKQIYSTFHESNKNNHMQFSKLSQTMSVIHKQTMNKRINDDIHSCVYRSEPEIGPSISKVRFVDQNQFRLSEQLGYENKKQKSLTCQKMTQIMGSTYCQKPQTNLRQKRDDWRRSTIVIE